MHLTLELRPRTMNPDDHIQDQLASFEEKRLELLAKKNKLQPLLFLVPVVVLITTLVLTRFPPIIIGGTALSVVISFMIYHLKIGRYFDELKSVTRLNLIEKFMASYHPDVEYNYHPEKHSVKNILDSVSLISADRYKEEDVVTGIYNDADFYFSEIHLQDKSTDKNGHTDYDTKFRGILFDLRLPGRQFPKTRIQSQRRLLQMLFNDFVQDEEHDFWYETEDERAYQETMQTLLPFISHLRHQQGDIRLEAEGERITLLMDSKMKFLDDPKQSLSKPLDGIEYKTKLAQQLNTLLFIVDSFVNNLENNEIVERLELQALEMAELRENKH